MRILFIILVIILVSSCQEKKVLDLETIYVDPTNSTSASLYAACDSIRVIKLENSQDFKGGNNYERVLIIENYIFIRHGQELDSKINIYSLDGKLINQLSKSGRGHGEYLTIDGFYYDSQEEVLIISSYYSKSLLYYSMPDLEFIKKSDLEFHPSLITNFKDNSICFGSNDDGDVEGILKEDGSLKSIFPHNRFNLSIANEIPILGITNNKLIYTLNDVDSYIYEVKDRVCEPKYKISFGEYALDDKSLYDNDDPAFTYNFKKEFDAEKSAGLVHNVMISENIVSFNYVYQKLHPKNSAICIYNLMNKTCVSYKGFNVEGIANPLFPQTHYNDYYVSLIIPDYISLTEEPVKNPLGEAIYEEITNSDDNRDPFLVLYRIKGM